jgi:hypothetical protein
MPQTADQLVALALQAAHIPGQIAQGRQLLNVVLADLCQTYDFAAARGQFFFNFNSSLRGSPAGWPGAAFGSGPYYLPVDYLRLSGSSGSVGAQNSVIWYLDGVPYPVVQCDLGEFDLQVQQAGLQSFVWLWATDMASPTDDRVLLSTQGDLTQGSNTIANLASTNRIMVSPGGVAGQGITPGTTVSTIVSSTSITMSNPATETIPGASLLFGIPPTGFVYPPPSSNQLVMVRYQRRMPDIFDFSRYPWFENDDNLLRLLEARCYNLADDTRAERAMAGPESPGSAKHAMSQWLAAKDDDANRAKTVQLDRRRFQRDWDALRTTKKVGWS